VPDLLVEGVAAHNEHDSGDAFVEHLLACDSIVTQSHEDPADVGLELDVSTIGSGWTQGRTPAHFDGLFDVFLEGIEDSDDASLDQLGSALMIAHEVNEHFGGQVSQWSFFLLIGAQVDEALG
jgi:hypothetical protein